jgi:hypothetical protein
MDGDVVMVELEVSVELDVSKFDANWPGCTCASAAKPDNKAHVTIFVAAFGRFAIFAAPPSSCDRSCNPAAAG